MKTDGGVPAPFVPASEHVIASGVNARTRDWIILGVLNGLVVAASHLIYAAYAFLGPAAVVAGFFHQSVENLLIASAYLLMVVGAPRCRPLTLNAVVWSLMGLMQGWWPMVPVAVPAGFVVDGIIRRTMVRRWRAGVLLGFALYTAGLSVSNFWPYLFLKQSRIMQRMAAMDPGFAAMVDRCTTPFFALIVASAFFTALAGGHMALKLIHRHFGMEAVC
jgi:hypothetical protein